MLLIHLNYIMTKTATLLTVEAPLGVECSGTVTVHKVNTDLARAPVVLVVIQIYHN